MREQCRLAVVPNTPPARAAPIVFPSKERCSTIHNYNSSSTTKILAIGSRPTRKKLERLDPCHGHPAVSSGIHPWVINASIHIDEKRVSYATGMSAPTVGRDCVTIKENMSGTGKIGLRRVGYSMRTKQAWSHNDDADVLQRVCSSKHKRSSCLHPRCALYV